MESIFKLGILLSVLDSVSGPTAKMGQGIDNLKSKLAGLGPAFDKFKTYGIRVAATGALLLHMLSGTVTATIPTQKALGELSSVGIQDLGALERAGAQFSGQWAGTTKPEFIAAAYDIKSGISSLTDTGVAEFTKLAALTGKATKSSTAEMTSLFATGYGIYKDMYANLSDMQFGEMFSAGIAGAVQAFKTTGSGMAQAISTMGASATVAKRPLEEQLAVLGMLQASMSGSQAGTAYSAIIRDVAAAGKTMGLNFYDANDNLRSLPEILTLMQGKFGDLTGKEGDIVKDAFTDESYKAISQLYSKIGPLTKNIEGMSAAMKQGTGFTEQMATAMNADIGSGIALLGQRFHNIVEVIGKQLIPVLSPLFAWIGNVINRLTEFAERHKTVTMVAVLAFGAIALLAFTLGTLAAVLGVVGMMYPSVIVGAGQMRIVFGTLKKEVLSAVLATKTWIVAQYSSLKTSIVSAGGVKAYASAINKNLLPSIWAWSRATIAGLLPSLGAAIAAVWSFTAALLANPITWVVVGIVALGVALYVLYKKFETVRTVVDGFLFVLGYMLGMVVRVGKGFLTALMHPILFVQSLFHTAGEAVGWLVKKFDGIGPALKGLAKLLLSFAFPPMAIVFNWDAIKTAIPKILDWIKGLIPQFMQAGSMIWDALVSGIKAKLMAPVEVIKGGLQKLRNLLPFSDAKEGPLSALAQSGAQLINTLVTGVKSAAPALKNAVAATTAGAMLATASPAIPSEKTIPATLKQPAAITIPVNQPVAQTVPVNQPAPTASVNQPTPVNVPVTPPAPVSVPIEQPAPMGITGVQPAPVNIPVNPLNLPTPPAADLAGVRRINIPVSQPEPVTVPVRQPEPVAASVIPPAPVTVPVNQPVPVSVISLPPDLVSVPVTQPAPVTASVNQPTPVNVPVTPPAPVSVPIEQPAPVGITGIQPAPVTIPIEQPSEISNRIMEVSRPEILTIPAVEKSKEKELSPARGATTIEKKITIQNLNITLPGVSNGEEFVEQLKKLVEQFDV